LEIKLARSRFSASLIPAGGWEKNVVTQCSRNKLKCQAVARRSGDLSRFSARNQPISNG
jgi:hypothetical protein